MTKNVIYGPDLTALKQQSYQRSLNGMTNIFNSKFTSDALGSDHVYSLSAQNLIYIFGAAQAARHHANANFPVLCVPSSSSFDIGVANHNKSQIIDLEEDLILFMGNHTAIYFGDVDIANGASDVKSGVFTFYPNLTQDDP